MHERQPGVRRADQDPVLHREHAPPALLLDRRDRLTRARPATAPAARLRARRAPPRGGGPETAHVPAVPQRPAPSGIRRQRGDLSAVEPRVSALPEPPPPRSPPPSPA